MLTKIANMWTTPFTRPFVIILTAEINDIILFIYLFSYTKVMVQIFQGIIIKTIVYIHRE